MENYTLEIFFILFAVMGIMVLTWFILCKKLFKLLKTNQPKKYKELGEISLLINNSPGNNLKFIRYLFKKEWIELNDENISKLSQFMLNYMKVYLVLFIVVAFFPIIMKQNIDSTADKIINRQALDYYTNTYKYSRENKAFAQSQSGAWAARINVSSIENAKFQALSNCQGYNENELTYPCRIIDVNNSSIFE